MTGLRRGQSLLEYTIVLVIVVAALLTMQTYIKRGLQGRWKDSVDQLGDQYDPGKMKGSVAYRVVSSSETRLQAVRDTNSTGTQGYYTMREDKSSVKETKNGSIQISY